MPVQEVTAEIEGKQYKIRMDIPRGSPPEAIQGAVGEWFQSQKKQASDPKTFAPPVPMHVPKSSDIDPYEQPARYERFAKAHPTAAKVLKPLQTAAEYLPSGDTMLSMAVPAGPGAGKMLALAPKSIARGIGKGLEEFNITHPQTMIIKALKAAVSDYREGTKAIEKGEELAANAREVAGKVK